MLSGKFIAITVILFALMNSAGAATYYCDPVAGNTRTGDGSSENPWGTLQSVVAAGYFNGVKIKSGDTLRLGTGFHGIFDLNGTPKGTAKKNTVCKNTDYITIEADTSAIADLNFIWLYHCEYWHFKGLRVSPSFSNQVTKEAKLATGGSIVYNKTGSKHIIIEDCNIFTTSDDIFSAWDAYERHDMAYTGITFPYMSYVTIHGNFIHDVADGIAAGGSASNPGNYNLIEQNTINNFGDDGIKTCVSNSIIQDNTITNVYKMLWYIKEDGTPEWTHSDGIQFLELPYPTIHDVIIRRNYINARTDPNRDRDFETLDSHALQATFLDGLVNGVIENNIIMGGHYTRGISINTYADNVRIVNNTLERPQGFTTSTRPVIHIPTGSVDRHKWGSRNVIVRNNIAYGFPLDSNELTAHPYSDYYENVVVENNFDIDSIVGYDPNVQFVDYANGNVHLAADSNFIDTGSSEDAPNEDLDKNLRPQGQGYDIGAYEFQSGAQQTCAGTDASCGVYPNCQNCNSQDGCDGNTLRDYYCTGTTCTFTEDDCSDCSCNCGDYNATESIANNNCADSKDNDCDTKTDTADEGCQAAECIDTAKMTNYIGQWKQGQMTMLALMQKMKQWKTGTGCA